jgi:uncharacterized protein YndB with AHSA1/START domain
MGSKLEVTPVGDREVLITRDFAAPRDLVFACWTKLHFVRQWLSGPDGWTFETCDIDLRPGGGYRYVWRHVNGKRMGLTGTLKDVAHPERLVSTEIFDDDWTGGETLVTALFTESGGTTQLAQSVLYSSRQAREGALFTGMTEGMEMGFARLDRVLAGMEKQAS